MLVAIHQHQNFGVLGRGIVTPTSKPPAISQSALDHVPPVFTPTNRLWRRPWARLENTLPDVPLWSALLLAIWFGYIFVFKGVTIRAVATALVAERVPIPDRSWTSPSSLSPSSTVPSPSTTAYRERSRSRDRAAGGQSSSTWTSPTAPTAGSSSSSGNLTPGSPSASISSLTTAQRLYLVDCDLLLVLLETRTKAKQLYQGSRLISDLPGLGANPTREENGLNAWKKLIVDSPALGPRLLFTLEDLGLTVAVPERRWTCGTTFAFGVRSTWLSPTWHSFSSSSTLVSSSFCWSS